MEPTVGDVLVGIDVSKDRLDVAVLPGGEAFAVARNAAGIDDLVARLKPLAPHAVALEATGGYESVMVASLAAVGLPAVVVNPAADSCLCPGAGQACQDGQDRRTGYRPLHASDRSQGQQRIAAGEGQAGNMGGIIGRRRR